MPDNRPYNRDTGSLTRILAAGTFWAGLVFSGLLLGAALILSS
jgi:hypothetical protein